MLSRVSKNLARAGLAQKVCFIYILFAINPFFYSKWSKESDASVIIEILEPLMKTQSKLLFLVFSSWGPFLATYGSNLLFLFRLQPKESFMQFSKEPIMNNFGELKFGEIPEPLKYARPFRKWPLIFSTWTFIK